MTCMNHLTSNGIEIERPSNSTESQSLARSDSCLSHSLPSPSILTTNDARQEARIWIEHGTSTSSLPPSSFGPQTSQLRLLRQLVVLVRIGRQRRLKRLLAFE
jgi:hypothetical protein